QYGNLIDRHNLWEMVGVRFRRALFPGYSDTAQFVIPCPSALARAPAEDGGWEDEQTLPGPVLETGGNFHVAVRLLYRKVDQSLLNYLFGEERGLTSPVATIDTAETVVTVKPADRSGVPPPVGETGVPTSADQPEARP